jgi:TonB family protein
VNYALHLLVLIVLSFFASTVTAQVAAASPSPLTPEQKTILAEANQLSRDAVELHRQRKLDEALPLAKRAIELRTSVLGERDPLVGEAVSNLATIYVAKQEFERAEVEFKKALTIYESSGFTVPHVGYVLDTLGLLRWRVRDFDKAETLAKRAIAFKEKLHAGESQLLESIDNLVKIYESAGKISERNALFSRVVSMAEEKKKTDLTDRQRLFRYRCLMQDGKQNAEAAALVKRIDDVLEWNPSAQPATPGGVLNGRALVLPKPAYPFEARAVRVSGTVVVQILIDECGRVVSAKAVSGDSTLRPVSEAAARKAVFSPTFVFGSPTQVTGVIQYHFVAR